jgi:N-acetylglucosaminyl-diphospho-decaprenol L-rhamnosyltransferase
MAMLNPSTTLVRPALSVIIVTYKSRGEIDNCLESIPVHLRQGLVEVIVVDNASNDGLVEHVRDRYPEVTLLAMPSNLGFGKANNVGYERCTGDFVLFLNPDTISTRATLEACLDRLESDPTIGILSPKLVMADGEMDLACRRAIPTVWDGFSRAIGLAGRFPKNRWFAGYNLTYLPENETYEVGAVNGAFMMCPRAALLRFGVFDEQIFMYGDDLDVCYRCRKAGYRVVYDGRHSIVHLKGVSSSKESEKMARQVFIGTKQFYLKHFNPHGSWWVRLKYGALFGLWQSVALAKAKRRGYAKARPL